MKPLSIERSTTVDRTAAALRAEILAGELAPGTRLRELELATALGVSRNTVRETLSVLAAEGLLTRTSYKGVVVTQLSAADVHDIYVARRAVELAAVDAAAAAGPDALAPLLAAVDGFVAVARSSQGDPMHLADAEVHCALVRLCGSARLSKVHADLLAELRLVLSPHYDSGSREEIVARHLEFADLLRRRDWPGARLQLERRLRASEAEVLGGL